MRKFNIMKGVSTALVAVALVTGLTVPVNAAKTDAQVSTQEVTLAGAATVAAPTISLKESTASGQTTTSWTFTYIDSKVPAPVEVTYNSDSDVYPYWIDNTSNKYDKYCLSTSKNYEQNITTEKRGYELVYAVYDKGDRTNPVKGSYTTDVLGKKVLNGYFISSYVDPQNYPNEKYEFSVSSGSLTPGTKEVVAYLIDYPAYLNDVSAAYQAAIERYKQAYAAYEANGYQGDAPKTKDYYSEKALGISLADYYVASSAISIDVSMETSVSTTVTATSIQLDMSSAGGATGYNIYRKIGKKYKKIATVASYVYLDKGLVSNTTYSYQVVPYYVNSTTGKTTTGKKTTVEATTKGSALNLQAKVTKKNKAQLTWQKVSGATEYEIYRADTNSSSSTKSKGLYNGYYTYKKIATVKKNKKSYTDKTVAANRDYTYIVRAILPKSSSVKGDKDRVVDGSASVSLGFGAIDVISSYTNATGDLTVNWNKTYGASGYVVEKYAYDAKKDTSDWVVVKTLNKNATSVKLAAEVTYQKNSTDGSVNKYKTATTKYRIRAYKGTSTYSDERVFYTTKSLGVVQKVTATKTTNGVKVSWTPVSGAAYYKVYRVRTDAVVNNKDKGILGTDALTYSGYWDDDEDEYVSEYTYNFENLGFTLVTEYVGYQTAQAVDVAAWNEAVDASIAQYKAAEEAYKVSTDPNKVYPKESDYLTESRKLEVNKSYHYQNYSYARSTFDANTTSIVDYYGDIYTGSGQLDYTKNVATKGADGKAVVSTYGYTYDPVVSDDNVEAAGTGDRPVQGVSYTYYVQAFMASATTVDDYTSSVAGTGDDLHASVDYANAYYDEAAYDAAKKAFYADTTGTVAYPDSQDYYYAYGADFYYAEANSQAAYNTAVTGPIVDKSAYATMVANPQYKDITLKTSGVKKLGTATYTNVSATKKPTLKSVTSSKGSATITIKKKVKKASYYKIYRSTKKKGKYTVAGITKNAKTLKFKDSDVTVGKTYYYKVVAVVKNEAGAEVESAASKIKKVTIKK